MWASRSGQLVGPLSPLALLVPLNVMNGPVAPVTVGSVGPAACTVRLIDPAPVCAVLESSRHGGQWFPLDVLLDPLPCYGALPDESCPTLALLASRSGQLVGPLSPLLLAVPFSVCLA